MSAGLDSLASVELQGELASTWKLELPGTLMFDYPTIQGIAAYIHEQLASSERGSVSSGAESGADSRAPFSMAMSQDQESKSSSANTTTILQMTCRLPAGAHDVASLIQTFQSGNEAVTEIPFSRWDVESSYSPFFPAPGLSYSRFGRFLPEVDKFDLSLFQLGRSEAMGIDPQHRLLLEESASILVNNDLAQIGVYVGCMYQEHAHHVLGPAGLALGSPAAVGNSLAFMVGRIAYTFGLTGTWIIEESTRKETTLFPFQELTGRQNFPTFIQDHA